MAISMNLKPASGRSHGRVPTKRSINFAEIGKQKTNYMSTVIVVVIVLVIAALVAKFGVMDRLDEVAAEEARTAELQTQLNQSYATIESFGELTETYARYTYSGMTDAEVTLADRVAVLDLIDRVVYNRCNVESWQLSGNELVLNINVEGKEKNMRQINFLTNELQNDPMVLTAQLTDSSAYKKTKSADDEALTVTTGRIKVTLKKKEVLKG